MRALLAAAMIAALLQPAAAQNLDGSSDAPTQRNAAQSVAVSTPAPGTREREALLNVFRASVEHQLGKTVRFVVKDLHVGGGWAFLFATMQGPQGMPFSYRGTDQAEAASHGLKSDVYAGLLQRQDSIWVVRTDRIGATDVPWIGWSARYGVPDALFLDFAAMPQRINDCAMQTILNVGPRLEGVPDSGSTVIFQNGGRQVSYSRVPAIDTSQSGDQVTLCLVSVPKNCPPGDERGKIYHATNLRTNAEWELPDSEH